MNDFRCPACGGPARRTRYRAGKWAVVECARCGLASTSPRPSDDELAAIYATADYYGERQMTTAVREEATARAADLLGRTGDGPLLDYGAGSGHLVYGARSLGVDADGVEPSAAGRRLASDLYDIELLAELPADAAGRYQAVTLVHVLEHVPEPEAVLRQLSDVLAADGRILIEVPHAGSTRFLTPSARRDVYDLPAHLYHFTPQTLAATVETAGLTVESVRLFNPWFLERLLTLRAPAAQMPDAETRGGRGEAGAAAEVDTRPGGLRGAWHRLLPRVRQAVPGEKFQLVARRS